MGFIVLPAHQCPGISSRARVGAQIGENQISQAWCSANRGSGWAVPTTELGCSTLPVEDNAG